MAKKTAKKPTNKTSRKEAPKKAREQAPSKEKEREQAAPETERLVLRLPASIKESLEVGDRAPRRGQLDWSPVREVLDGWAKRAKQLKVDVEDPTEQVCFHVSAGTAEALRREADRLTEATGSRWTVSKVVAALWAEHG